jgi:hypothetical protein
MGRLMVTVAIIFSQGIPFLKRGSSKNATVWSTTFKNQHRNNNIQLTFR